MVKSRNDFCYHFVGVQVERCDWLHVDHFRCKYPPSLQKTTMACLNKIIMRLTLTELCSSVSPARFTVVSIQIEVVSIHILSQFDTTFIYLNYGQRYTGQCHSNPQHIYPRRIWYPWQLCTITHCYRSWPRLWYHLFWPRPSCICPFRMHRLILCCCLFSVHPLSRSYLCQCTRSTWGQKLKWNLRENETLARKINW